LSYGTQYIVLACMFGVMMMWNFVSLNSVSNATATLAQMASKRSQVQIASKEFTKVKNELADLNKKVNILGEIDSKIDVANLLAEMSFLIDENIVLSKVEFISERFKQPNTNVGAAVRVAGTESDRLRGPHLGDVLFKVLISGIAADASDVAALVRKLEESPYFCKVYPSISRNKTVQVTGNTVRGGQDRTKRAPNSDSYRVSEFEISCYLANYRQEKL
jgi:hypothetical protein